MGCPAEARLGGPFGISEEADIRYIEAGAILLALSCLPEDACP